ncbi:PopZ family protein [Bosea sp. (in: a-proteobacteria)]|uniref:PopZ family protein n=1 Tax=Bosea sp. (in: a-proteobacteria) TaxID=1871050 RepID=UPI0035266009
MSAQPKPNEPSMEEILASIRRIISDDEKPAEEAAAIEPAPIAPEEEAPPPPPPPPVEDDDVLDLGAEAARIMPADEPAELTEGDVDFLEPPPAPEPVLPPPAPEPEPVAAPIFAAAPAPPPALDMAQLLSDQTSSAVTSAFGQLAHTVLTNNARTLEDLVKDMLKPMLKTWLDDNLPTMVERLVRAEIERVARGGRN